jgi:hypothetical protein
MGEGEDRAPNPDQAWKTLDLVNDWIKHADAKIAVTLAATAASGVMLFNLAKGASRHGHWFVALVTLTALGLGFTALCAFTAIVPRVTLVKKKQPEKFDNLLFYRHIANGYRNKANAYALALGSLTMDRQSLTQQIAEQVHANSIVADRKYKWADRALRALAVGVVLLTVTAGVEAWGDGHARPHRRSQDPGLCQSRPPGQCSCPSINPAPRPGWHGCGWGSPRSHRSMGTGGCEVSSIGRSASHWSASEA